VSAFFSETAQSLLLFGSAGLLVSAGLLASAFSAKAPKSLALMMVALFG